MRAVIAAMCLLSSASLLTTQRAYAQGAPRVAPGTELGDTWGDKTPPEGFVKSKEPKKSESAYNWVQMGYASIIMIGMAGFIVYLVRRNTRTLRDDASENHSDATPGV